MGLLTERDIRFVRPDSLVAERMTPRAQLVVSVGPISLEDAERLMIARKVKKLPLVNPDGTLLGLITAKDLIKQKHQPFATRDAQGRLRVGRGDWRDRRLSRARGRSAPGRGGRARRSTSRTDTRS